MKGDQSVIQMTQMELNEAVARAYVAFVDDAVAKSRVALTEHDLGLLELAFSVGSDRAIAAIIREGNTRFERKEG
jgi:uncharacterized protein (UPF0210 family)